MLVCLRLEHVPVKINRFNFNLISNHLEECVPQVKSYELRLFDFDKSKEYNICIKGEIEN